MRLKQWREGLGLSQMELARVARVSQSMISRYEQGVHVPPPTVVERIVSAYGISPSVLGYAVTMKPVVEPSR